MLLILLEWMSMSAPGLHIRTNESWSGQVVKVWPLIVVKSEGQSRKWRSWPPHWSWVPNKFATSTFDESLFPREGLRTTKTYWTHFVVFALILKNKLFKKKVAGKISSTTHVLHIITLDILHQMARISPNMSTFKALMRQDFHLWI